MWKRSIALACLAALSASTDAQDGDGITVAEPPIIIDSESNEYDLRSGVTRFTNNVSIVRGEMEVDADSGMVMQEDGRITVVELEGDPTTWRDRLEDGSLVTGEALRIHYDVVGNIVTLTGNARITHAQGEFTGHELIYDLDTESLAGRSEGDGRVRVVIEPETATDEG
ncbi:MAG: lipopolysaccharide transport periplasmic protein LptA [Wenzhouxiangellaceae bacterium]|nr:lipopolysaccharide transport periplasmic protein LptA [Wenzhouxiangellaceae bacterium]